MKMSTFAVVCLVVAIAVSGCGGKMQRAQFGLVKGVARGW